VPISKITLAPGINVEKTQQLNEGTWSFSDRIRWRDGLPEPIGGWVQYYPTALPQTIRSLHAWQAINGIEYLAAAGTSFVGVLTSGTLMSIGPSGQTDSIPTTQISCVSGGNLVEFSDSGLVSSVGDYINFVTPVTFVGAGYPLVSGVYEITSIAPSIPVQNIFSTTNTFLSSTSATLPTFSTTSGSATVTIAFATNAYSVGEQFTVAPALSVGGLTLSGAYTIQSINALVGFTINAAFAATSTATATLNGGNAQIQYLSRGANLVTGAFWTMDNWGEILLLCPNGGTIYQWSPENGGLPAQPIGTAPALNGGIFVAMPEQICVAWGSTGTGGTTDPLLVRWSDVNDYTDWTPTITNQAGSQRIPTGSKVKGAIQAANQAFIFTDIDVYAMSYVGSTFVFGFNKLADGCGLVGPFAVGALFGQVFWMGIGQFFVYNSAGVQPMACPIWDVVYQQLDTSNLQKIHCGINSKFNEVWWFYPSTSGSGEVDSYIKINMLEQAWDYGTVARTAWVDQSVLGSPIGAAPGGILYQHETGTTANGSLIGEYVESGAIQISEGDDIVFVDWVLPDFKWGLYGTSPSTTVTITPKGWMYASDTPTVFGPYNVQQSTQFFNPRIRARTISVRLNGNGYWRMGSIRYRAAPDGKM
jgi:hypothetical protein